MSGARRRRPFRPDRASGPGHRQYKQKAIVCPRSAPEELPSVADALGDCGWEHAL